MLLDTGFQINQPVIFPEQQRAIAALAGLPMAPQWELPVRRTRASTKAGHIT